MKISQKILLLSALLFLVSATTQAMGVNFNHHLVRTSLNKAVGLNNANLFGFTLYGASKSSSNGTFSISTGVSLFLAQPSTSLFASDGDPLSLGETRTSKDISSPTQIRSLIRDTLTLAYLEAVFGEVGGLRNNGATNDLTRLSTNDSEVSDEALGTNVLAFSGTSSAVEQELVNSSAVEQELVNSSAVEQELVNSSAVPIPAAVWLFSSVLMGLMGFKRKK